MSKKIFGRFDKAGFEVLPSDPLVNLFQGRLYYNSGTNKLRVYTGASWADVSTAAVSDGLSGGGDYFYTASDVPLGGYTTISGAIQIPSIDGVNVIIRTSSASASVQCFLPETPAVGDKFTIAREFSATPTGLNNSPLVLRPKSKYLLSSNGAVANQFQDEWLAPHGFVDDEEVVVYPLTMISQFTGYTPGLAYYVYYISPTAIGLRTSPGGAQMTGLSNSTGTSFYFGIAKSTPSIRIDGMTQYVFTARPGTVSQATMGVSKNSFMYTQAGMWVSL